MAENLDLALLLAAGVVLVGVLAVRVSARLGLPGLLLYLMLGVLLGESGFGIRFDDAAVARDLGVMALVVILAEGGLTTRWSDIRPVIGVSLMLATVGVAISVTAVGIVVHLVMDVGLQTSLLMGGVIASTDAAAVFSVLRRLRLRSGVRATLEAESGLNDPLAIVIVVLVVSGELTSHSWLYDVGLVAYELVAGAVIGITFGVGGRWLLQRIALPAVGLYPLAALATVVAGFATAEIAHASGFLAVYVAALVIGSSSRLPHRRSVLGFTEGLAWLAQIGMFVLLGLLASPPRLTSAIPLALAAGIGLVIGRPLTVLASATPFRVPWTEQAFFMAAGLRGAVPIVLASIALAEGTLDAAQVFDATFLLVVVLTAIQAPPLPWLARRLGVGGSEAGELEVESAPLDELNAALLEIEVPPESRLVGLYVEPDLRLPKGASVTLVVRDGMAMVPNVQTRIRAGDRILVVATSQARRAAERRMRAVSRSGPVAGWFGERGD